MKRTLSLAIVAALLVASFAGCSKSAPSTPAPASSAAPISSAADIKPAESKPEDKPTYPLEGSPSFTYWLQLHANISPFANNFGDTDLAKNWQEATGAKLTFEHPSGTANNQMLESLNIMFASGSYPDMIHFEWTLYPGGVEKLYNEGIINMLNDPINNWAPNLAKYLNDNPEQYRLAKADNGSIYKMPMFMEGAALMSTSGPMVREDLLKKHNLAVPETVADWDAYLKAIKGDVETPFICIYTDLGWAWMRTFNTWQDFYNKDGKGKIEFGPSQPEYKDFLTQMNAWYKDGLFDRNFVTTDRKAVDAAMSSGTAGACRGSGGQQLGAYIPLLQKANPEWNLVPAKYPTINKGDAGIKYNNLWGIKNTGNVVITTKCKDLENAVKFLDYAYSPEGIVMTNFGIEGKSFEMKDGVPTYSDNILNPTNGKTFAQELSNWTFANWNGPFIQDEPYIYQYYALQQQKDALGLWSQVDANVKDLTPTTMAADEASEYAKIFADIKTYVDENTQMFIKGDKSLDEFDKFVAEIEKMNIARCIEIKQAAFDRFEKR